MKRTRYQKLPVFVVVAAALSGAYVASHAGTLSLSNVPLGTGSGVSVKPNLLFILDDSGSMHSEYMPDYISADENCPDSNDNGTLNSCVVGDPPYSAATFNTMYYNPATRYYPPKKADGTSFDNASTTTPYSEFFPLDSSGSPASTGTKTLASYQNTAWCKNSGDTPSGVPATDTNCAYYPVGTSFNDYPKYPNATYKYRRTYNGPPVYYVMTGVPQWCDSTALTTCQSTRTGTYAYPKFAASAVVNGVRASRTFLVNRVNAGTVISFICYNDDADISNGCQGTNLLSSPITIPNGGNDRSRRQALADALAGLTLPGGWTITKLRDDTSANSALTCGEGDLCAQLMIQAPGSTTSLTNTTYNNKYLTLDEGAGTGVDFYFAIGSRLSGGVDYQPAAGAVSFIRYQITSGGSYPKASGRTDCAGSTCTGAEELQNFANWYQFYRRRLSMVKTAISRAYAGITDTAPGAGFRVGLMTISAGASETKIDEVGDNSCWTTNRQLEVNVGDFSATQKATFYSNLFQIKQCSYTPLRGALSRAGRYYAGQNVNNGYTIFSDPVQYACQQNFSFLSTDGYWNTQIEDGSYGPKQTDNSTNVGNVDGSGATYPDGAAVIRPQLDALNASNTLADVAFYYYKTDLRSSMANEVPPSSRDPYTHQHMVTFTMGLGVNGLLSYNKDYETGGSADYNAILNSTKDWPNPGGGGGDATIDDLWHAAVNGRGKYFSASNPEQVATSMTEALVSITAITGAGAAAATSNLEPTAGDNYAYVASYRTVNWDGELEAKTIDLTTGALSDTAIWQARAVLNGQAAAATTPSGSSGPGTRNLFTFNSSAAGTDKKILLTWANVQTKGWDGSVLATDYFNPAQLSQCPTPATNCPAATRQNLFTFLMGGANTSPEATYRARSNVLGDIVSSQPVYVKKPQFSYSDAGYDTYKTSTRKGMVYVGANDGFLHAFDADTGNEDWAYVPSFLLPQLYQLASSNYAHRYYVDGSVSSGDVKVGSDWKTIIVGGMNAGGKGYYAIDVTNPASPVLLWEFTDGRMGYTYGSPIITKLPAGATSAGGANIEGKWVVLLTSGYNNGGTAYASHNGQGVLYVVDAYTGVEYFRIYGCTNQSDDTTCAGSSASPSGLAKINAWVQSPSADNTSLYVYGGDLEGNLWRFTLEDKSAFKVAAVGEPITVKPELAEISGKRVVYFGTGIFLQLADKNDTTRRSIYAIRDNPAATSALTNVKSSGDLIEQTMSVLPTDTSARTVTSPNPVDWTSKYGWFVTLLEDRERVNVDPKIQLGTLVVASNVPDAGAPTACTTGGHAWLNFLDIATGAMVVNNQSNPLNVAARRIGNALVVGVNVIKLPNGKLVAMPTLSDNQRPPIETPVGSSNLPLKRISWRELVTD